MTSASAQPVVLVAAARPNFMKVAPVHRALVRAGVWPLKLVHAGQHYDPAMSAVFFRDLGIPEPDLNLEVGSGSHALQTASVLRRFEQVVKDWRPRLVVVVGDVNSTLAAALAAKKVAGVGVAHVEAGLRSGDRTMPEEVNRLVTDALSDLLFTSERSGDRNLLAEGVPPACIHFAGNVMIDTLLDRLPGARALGAPARFGVTAKTYALLTLHRPANVDDAAALAALLDAVASLARDCPMLFPVHPRGRDAIDAWLAARPDGAPGLRLLPPLGYIEFLGLMADAALVMTDSGGIQEETTVLGVPCLTLRDSTERPVTVEQGTNTLVGRDPVRLMAAAREVLTGRSKRGSVPEGWDGKAAERIAEVLARWDGRLR